MRRKFAILAAAIVILVIGVLGGTAAASAEPDGKPTGKVDIESTVWTCDTTGDGVCTSPVARVNLRGQPNTGAKVIETMSPGDRFRLWCWTDSQSINGDTVWYWGRDESLGVGFENSWPIGWAAGYYLDTGRDPLAGIGHC
jgi:hypothetical protein